MTQPTVEKRQVSHLTPTLVSDPQNDESRRKSSSSTSSRARSLSVGGYETGALQRRRSAVDLPLSWTENNWTGPSPAMIAISNPVRTTPDGKVAQSRAVRQARVEAIRRRRTAQHVSMFVRINIVVTPALSFSVTVEADRNIEYLARYVEAEYAFRYNPRPTVNAGDGGDAEYEPLECGLLYDSGMVPLRYTDRIGDVLNMNDVVHVLNASEDSPSIRQETDSNVVYSIGDLSSPDGADDAHCTDEEHQSLVEGAAPSNHSDATESEGKQSSSLRTGKPAEEPHRKAVPGKIYRLISSPTSDDRCISILHNKLGLEYLQQFCTRTYSVENLLFWLDTEMFQFAKSSSSALLQARYIYMTYIEANAPLQVNLPEEIRKDVPWPLPDGWLVDPNMFDEAQEHVYFILRKHTFPMFEESDLYQKFLKVKREDRDKYEAARIIGPFTDFFAPNLEVMRSCADLATHTTRQWGMESNSRSDLWIKEQLLDRTMNKFFASHGPVVDYFSDSHRLTTAQKARKVQKEKKLARFFGEKPSSDLIARQTHKQPPSPAFIDDHTVQKSNADAGEADSEFYSKKKKVEKLEGFFGDRLGQSQLMDQKLMTSGDILPTRPVSDFPAFSMILRRSTSSPQSLSEASPILVTSNDLSLEERRLLSKRSRKLRGILGEPLNEDIVASALTNPAKGVNTESSEHTNTTMPNAISARKTDEGAPDHTEMHHQKREGAEGAPKTTHHRHLERSQSYDSMKTVDSVRLDRNSREYRRKKLEKLYQFLGEKIPTSTLSGQPVPPENSVALVEAQTDTDQLSNLPSGKQLSHKEKQANIKRFNKLERLLGEHPPSDLLSNTDTVTLQTQSLANLGKLLTGPDLVLELVDYLSDFEQSVTTGANQNTGNAESVPVQRPTPIERSASIVSSADSGTVSQPNSFFNREASDLETISNADKLARQRKLMKLKRFFGDQLDPVHLVEQSILEDLEKSIDDEMTSGKDVSQLKRDLRKLRDEIRKRSALLQFFDSDDKLSTSSSATPSPDLSRSGTKFPPNAGNKFGTPTRAKLKSMVSASSPKDAAIQQSTDDNLPSPCVPSPSSNSSKTPIAVPPA